MSNVERKGELRRKCKDEIDNDIVRKFTGEPIIVPLE